MLKLKEEKTANAPLEEVLNNIKSMEIVAKLVSKFVGKREISEKNINATIEYYSRRIRWLRSTCHEDETKGLEEEIERILEEAKITDKLIYLYVNKAVKENNNGELFYASCYYTKAAELAEECSRFREAIFYYKKAGDFAKVAELYEKERDIKNAIKYYAKTRNIEKSKKLADYINNINFAIKSLKRAGFFLEAGELAEERGMNKKAYSLYLKLFRRTINFSARYDNNFLNFARIAKRIGEENYSKKLYYYAISKCEQERNFDKAAEIAKEAGLVRSKKIYENLEKLLKSTE